MPECTQITSLRVLFNHLQSYHIIQPDILSSGYYADPEAECQVFHICTADGFGGLSKYSFLCPNGTIFNQNYFICDWWFNFDCAEAESLYGKNDEIRAEGEAATGGGGGAFGDQPIYAGDAGATAPAGDYGAATAPAGDYGAATDDYAATGMD